MESAAQEQTAPETQAAPVPATEKAKKKSNAFVYAVVQDVTTGELTTISQKQKRDLSKQVAEHPNWKVVGVFKGKQLAVHEKKAFNFN